MNDILQAVIVTAMLTHPYAQIVTGSMPPRNGLAMTAETGTERTDMNMGALMSMNIVFNGKSNNQKQVINTMEMIHKFLSIRKKFPNGNEWQVYSIETMAAPHLIGREAENQWLYGSILKVNYYRKGLKNA